MLTGTLSYESNNYTFILNEDSNELILISPLSDESINPLTNFNSIVFSDNSLIIHEPYLKGITNETHKQIIAFTQQNSRIKKINNVLYIKLIAYIIFNANISDEFNQVAFSSDEIDRIFNVNRTLNLGISEIISASSTGIINISTKGFEETTSKPQEFVVKGKEVSVYFDINRNISKNIGKPPLSLNSFLCFKFSPTDDYSFIWELCTYAKQFVRFLCYRNNINFTSIKLYSPYENDKLIQTGNIFLCNQNQFFEKDPQVFDRCIKYEYISGSEGLILSDIVKSNIYFKHIPKSFDDGNHIDTARFIMITSAFEWEFAKSHPDGITKSERTLKAEKEVSDALTVLMNQSTGDKRNKYKFLLRLVKSDSLESKILQTLKDQSEVLDDFGKYLYKINNASFDHTLISKRISTQRNHYAHGDLDKEFINESLLDVYFLTLLVYALQLKSYSLSITNIQKSINDLFSVGIDLT